MGFRPIHAAVIFLAVSTTVTFALQQQYIQKIEERQLTALNIKEGQIDDLNVWLFELQHQMQRQGVAIFPADADSDRDI